MRQIGHQHPPELIIYYDNLCEVCNRGIGLLKKYGRLRNVDYRALSEAPKEIQKISQENNSWIIKQKSEYFIGYSGFLECVKQSKIFFWYGYIGNIEPLKTLGTTIYKIVSSRRTCAINKNKKL